MIKRRRCDECRRRRKRCTGSGSSCELCCQKGLHCNNFGFQVVEFNGPENKVVKPSITPRRPKITQKPLYIQSPRSSPASTSSDSLQVGDQEKKPITSSSLISLIKQNLPESVLNINLGIAQPVHLPKVSFDKSNPIPFLQDSTTIRIFDNEVTIPKGFSLLDFLLSSSRVDFMNFPTCNLEQEGRHFEEIGNLLKLMKTNKAVEALRQDGYSINERSDQFPIERERSFKNLGDVEFKIDLERLKTNFFLQRASIDDQGSGFANLPDFIDVEFANTLFHNFCAMAQDATKQDASVSDGKGYVKVNFLRVCFPLIFGNITVLKSVLIVSYYHWKVRDPQNGLLTSMKPCIKKLYLSVLEELQNRLTNGFSISCDHTILSVILLLSAEVIRGLTGTLWRKLLSLVKDMIVLRGGVSSLVESLTGVCLMKLLSVHLSIGGIFGNQSLTQGLVDGNQLSFADFVLILETHHQLDFYDNLNFFTGLGLRDIRGIIKLYGHITQFHNLSAVSFNANNFDNDTMSYESVSLQNLELVLSEAQSLEKELELSNETYENLPEYYRLQILFSHNASLLYLFQMVYRQSSLAPKTVLVVKNLLNKVHKLFDVLENLDSKTYTNFAVFIFPLFLLGVDIASSTKRKWFSDRLNTLYKLTKKETLKTCINLLGKVWESNPTGTVYVDWTALSKEHGLNVCLYS